MTFPFHPIRFPQADHPRISDPPSENRAKRLSIQQPVDPEPALAFLWPAILSDRNDFELAGSSQGYAMLRDIGGIFGRVELDLHPCHITDPAAIPKGFCIYENRIRRALSWVGN
jgi:hypothetical protein